MYIPDEFLGWHISFLFFLIMLPLWFLAFTKTKEKLKSKYIQIISLGTSFSLIILMPNIPFLENLPAQITGATILSILFGPWTSTLIISIALLVKTIINNGELTLFAVNCFILGFAASFSSYYLYRRIINIKILKTQNKRILGSILGSYFSSITIASIAGLLIELQFILNSITTSTPIIFPTIIKEMIFILLINHFLIVGVIEAILTIITIVILKMEEGYILNLISQNQEETEIKYLQTSFES